MKFSDNYILYPMNRVLERAISDSRDLLSAEQSRALFPDRTVTVADNFLHSRGNFEQQTFSSNIFEHMVEALEAELTDELRQKLPLDWAALQNRRGNILAAQAQQQQNSYFYEKALACFNAALEEYKQEESPLEWAETQANLGTTLQAQGRLESSSKLLGKAVDAYTAALLEYTKTKTPEEWKLVMLQLGMALHSYGLQLKGNRNFQKSVVAYKNAISELDADNYPFEYTAAFNNCGAVLHNLAESEENPERMQEAIRAYETAGVVCLEQQRPVHLSVLIRVNKTRAQAVLAEMNNDAVLADEVADEFEIILECFPHALQPLCAKYCEEQMSKMRKMAESSAA
ncbi:MAG: tetratricopeptide repeat protein [Gammaproteobacteria bacterium]|nr:tetratricopeptide repeat protein [Gammaproteobacteria bacterium]